MGLKTVAPLMTLGVLVLLRSMTSVVLAYDVDSDFAGLNDFETYDYIEAAKATQQQQTYTPEELKSNKPNLANSNSSDDFKIDDDSYGMLKEGKNKCEKSRFHMEVEFLKRKHTAHAEDAAQRRDKRQEAQESGPNCTITNQTLTNQTFTNRSFINCTFTNCTFTICTFNNCTFSNRSFTNCTFTKCTFDNTTFSNLTFTNCTFTVCTFTIRSFFNCAFTNCTFTVGSFPDCNFTNCTFTSSTFTPPTIHNCN